MTDEKGQLTLPGIQEESEYEEDQTLSDKLMTQKEPEKPSFQAWMCLILILLINIGSQWQRFAIAYADGFEGDPGLEHDNPEYEIDQEFL